MTTICFDGSVLAADKRSCGGNGTMTVTKIRRINGSLVGCAGNSAIANEVMAWFERGAVPADFPPAQRDENDSVGMLVVEKSGAVYKFERSPYPIRLEESCVAIGSGGDYARAAMALGKTAAEAIDVAAMFDPGTGNGVDTLAF